MNFKTILIPCISALLSGPTLAKKETVMGEYFTHTNSYVRDTGDNNGNGIRNDVEAYINSVYASGTQEHQHLGVYAIYLQKLVSGSYGPSSTLYYDLQNMVKAMTCVNNPDAIAEVDGRTMDSEAAITRYITASAALGESQYGRWGTISVDNTCLLPSNFSADDGILALYEKTQKEKHSLISKVSKGFPKEQTEKQLSSKTSKTVDSLSPSYSASATATGQPLRYVLYINGMQTPYRDALINKLWIQLQLVRGGADFTNIQHVENADEFFLLDLVQAMKQYVNTPNYNEGWYRVVADFSRMHSYIPTDWIPEDVIIAMYKDLDWTSYRDGTDYLNAYKYASDALEVGNAIILAHSQGNFFANEVWEQLNNENDKKIKNRLRVIGLASPASYIPENFLYFNNSQDKILQSINEYLPVKTMDYNMFRISAKDKYGHGLKEIYMAEGTPQTKKVVETVSQYFDEMEGYDPNATCESTVLSGTSVLIHKFRPTNSGFKGTLDYAMNFYDEGNRMFLRDQNDNDILTTSNRYLTGLYTGSFLYDEASMGELTLVMGGDNSWRFSLLCPN